MAPQLSEDEVDDLIYLARTGDNDELQSLLTTIAEREKVSPAEVLIAAKDEGKSTCLHMAAANGHSGKKSTAPYTLCPSAHPGLLNSPLPHLSPRH